MRRWLVIAVARRWRSARCRASAGLSTRAAARRAMRRQPGDGRRSPGRFRATAGPPAARSAATRLRAAARSSSMCGRRSASAIATRGVADDDEVDRVADLDLISARFAPLKPGKAVRVADMAGRSRAYDLKMPDGSQHAAIGIALSHRCDLLVAVAQGNAHTLRAAARSAGLSGVRRDASLDAGGAGRAVVAISPLLSRTLVRRSSKSEGGSERQRAPIRDP